MNSGSCRFGAIGTLWAFLPLFPAIVSGALVSDYPQQSHVTIPSGETLEVKDADMAHVNAFSSFTVSGGARVTFDISGEATLSCLVTNAGEIVKKGDGALKVSNPGTMLEDGSLKIEKGWFWSPQDQNDPTFYAGDLTVEKEGVFVTSYNGYTYLSGLWGDGVVTNCASSTGVCQLRINRTNEVSCVFGGIITGNGIRYYSTSSVAFTGVDSNYKGSFQIHSTSRTDHPSVVEVRKLGNKGEKSSIGSGNEFGIREFGGTILYTGTGETTSKLFQYFSKNGAKYGYQVFDAGAHGNITFTGEWRDGSSGYAECLVLTGSNASPCTVSGPWNNTPPDSTYVIKRGTGKWIFADHSDRKNAGVIAVEEGTLGFTSIAETNKVCSLGLANALHSAYVGAYNANKKADYAYVLGTPTTRGTMEYMGAAYVDVSTRTFLLGGEGEISLGEASQGTVFSISGARASNDKAVLVLSGRKSTHGVFRRASDGDGVLGITKEGEGEWTLVDADDISGEVNVKEGTLIVAGDNSGTNDWEYFRFQVNQTLATRIGENDMNISFAGLRFYDAEGNVLTSSKNMAFVPGEAYGDSGEDRCFIQEDALGYGEYGWTSGAMYYRNYGTRDIDLMFDLNTSAARICVALRNPQGYLSARDAKPVISMRLPKNIKRPVAFDVYASQNGTYKRAISDWTLYASRDGKVWYEVAAYGYDAQTMPGKDCWYSDKSADKDAVRPGAGYAIMTFTNKPLSKVSSVRVGSGATLKAAGEVSLSLLTLDVSDAGNGMVDGFDFAVAGTLSLRSEAGLEDGVRIPVTFANCSGLANMEGWDVELNGKDLTGYSVKVAETGVSVNRVGLVLMVR